MFHLILFLYVKVIKMPVFLSCMLYNKCMYVCMYKVKFVEEFSISRAQIDRENKSLDSFIIVATPASKTIKSCCMFTEVCFYLHFYLFYFYLTAESIYRFIDYIESEIDLNYSITVIYIRRLKIWKNIQKI